MEKIIQIAGIGSVATLLTNEGRVFFQKPGEIDWIEAALPPLHTNEIDHTNESHSCTHSSGEWRIEKKCLKCGSLIDNQLNIIEE